MAEVWYNSLTGTEDRATLESDLSAAPVTMHQGRVIPTLPSLLVETDCSVGKAINSSLYKRYFYERIVQKMETWIQVHYLGEDGIWRTLGGFDTPLKCHSAVFARQMVKGIEKDLSPADILMVKVVKEAYRDMSTGRLMTIRKLGGILE